MTCQKLAFPVSQANSAIFQAFDEDVRHLVNVHVVHGFWKDEESAALKVCTHPNGLASVLGLSMEFS
jgi:hypothetical protein